MQSRLPHAARNLVEGLWWGEGYAPGKPGEDRCVMTAEGIITDSERRYREEYQRLVLSKYMRFIPVSTLVLITGVSWFIYEDFYVNGLPGLSLLFRLLPMGGGLLLLGVHYSPLRSRMRLMIFLYYLCLGCLMAMMAGLIVITSRLPNYEIYVYGAVVAVFVVYVCNLFDMRYLLPVYGIPLGGALVILIIDPAVPLGRIAILSNPLATSIASCVMAQMHDRIQYREFLSGKIIERQNAMLNNELVLAERLQRSMVPTTMPRLAGVDINVIHTPMIGIGGDLYDYIETGSPDALGIFMCDVSGHGVAAALISSMVKANLNAIRATDPSPRQLMDFLNEHLVDNIGNYFVTAIYGRLSKREAKFTYCRGGHNYPLLARGGAVTELKGEGKMLGFIGGLYFEEVSLDIRSGDRIVLYTDGLIEARNEAGEHFGEERLQETVGKNERLENAAFVEAVYNEARVFQHRQTFQDDVCIISIHIL